MIEILEFLEDSPIGAWVAYSLWGYPISLVSHALGMAVVVGLTAIICIRILGFPKAIKLSALQSFVPWMIAGMALNAISGIALFLGGATTLFYNIAFQLKLLAILLGIVLICFLSRRVLTPAAEGTLTTVTVYTRVLAVAVTLVWWVSVVLSGRLIAYVGA